jgi:O-antigen ligase
MYHILEVLKKPMQGKWMLSILHLGGTIMLGTTGFSLYLLLPLIIILILIGVTIKFFKNKSKKDKDF